MLADRSSNVLLLGSPINSTNITYDYQSFIYFLLAYAKTYLILILV